jgi:hypothetical protein
MFKFLFMQTVFDLFSNVFCNMTQKAMLCVLFSFEKDEWCVSKWFWYLCNSENSDRVESSRKKLTDFEFCIRQRADFESIYGRGENENLLIISYKVTVRAIRYFLNYLQISSKINEKTFPSILYTKINCMWYDIYWSLFRVSYT